jgi:pSer/pThr/pTyr-binding forkhead associated (FHA) protein
MAKIEDTPILIAQTGPLNGQRWSLTGDVIIGRDDGVDVVVPSRQVSRQHARLTPTRKGATLEDLGSKNGTFINGQTITEPIQLQDGDVISIALAQQFTYFSSDATMPLESVGIAPEASLLEDTRPRRLKIDSRSRRVWVNNQEILPPLSLSQYSLLELLYQNDNQVVDRKEMIENVWGEEDAIGVSEQALDALVRRLRDRIAAIDPTHAFIVTVRGHGLRLDNPPA